MKYLLSVLVSLPSVALAHPGSHDEAGLMHLLTEPDHLAMIAAVVALLCYLVYRRMRQ